MKTLVASLLRAVDRGKLEVSLSEWLMPLIEKTLAQWVSSGPRWRRLADNFGRDDIQEAAKLFIKNALDDLFDE